MYFGLSDDQIFFQDNVKKFLEDNAPLDVIKKIASNEDKLSKDDLHRGIINLGINNLLDSDPPINGDIGYVPGNANTFPSFYDPLGRYLFLKISKKIN